MAKRSTSTTTKAIALRQQPRAILPAPVAAALISALESSASLVGSISPCNSDHVSPSVTPRPQGSAKKRKSTPTTAGALDCKDWQCEICQKYYASAASLRKHRTHSHEEKPDCIFCGTAVRSDNMARHWKKHCKSHPDRMLNVSIACDSNSGFLPPPPSPLVGRLPERVPPFAITPPTEEAIELLLYHNSRRYVPLIAR